METPTISKTQKRSTLSAKKTKVKETVKNVVATPYKHSYWPQISPEDFEMLKIVLENNLPRVKPNKINVPWKLLKNIPKNDRKKFRNEYTKYDEMKINKKDREGLTFGINDVTKLLEKELLGAILISSNVQPKIMVRHILDGAVLHRIPIIIFDDLKSLTSKICGITSAVISINKDLDPESKLNLIKEKVIQVFEKISPPLDHINYQRSLQNFDNMETSENKDEKVSPEKCISESNDDIESTIYLKREPNGKRVFVPEGTREHINITKMEVDSSGFLPFSEVSTPEVEKKCVRSNYKSVIVKRLKGDPNRNKRKIESLKRKLK